MEIKSMAFPWPAMERVLASQSSENKTRYRLNTFMLWKAVLISGPLHMSAFHCMWYMFTRLRPKAEKEGKAKTKGSRFCFLFIQRIKGAGEYRFPF